MKTRVLGHLNRGFSALAVAVLCATALATAQGDEPQKPPPAATPPSAPPAAPDLQAAFTKADAARAATPANTSERATAARAAGKAASDLAWAAFDAGKSEASATWFARSAELEKESQENARAHWEQELKTSIPEMEKRLRARAEEFRAQLPAAEKDEAKTKELRGGINALEQMIPVNRYNAFSMLQTIARDSNDNASRLKYSEECLAIRREELAWLTKSGAPEADINRKKIEIARGMELVGEAQAELARFDDAEKSYLAALEIRKAMPESMPERKLDESLNALGYMYLHNVGDFAKARRYYEEALAAFNAGADARKAALDGDPWTPEIKAKMTPEALASHVTSLAQNRDMTMAINTLVEGTILNNLGDVALEAGDYKTGQGFYDRATKLVEAMPHGGYLNIFELARAKLHARTIGDLADLHAASGQTELALRELAEAIQIKRAMGEDESTARSLQQVARLAYDKGDLETARRNVEQARQIYVSARRMRSIVSASADLAVFARDAGNLEEAAKHGEEALRLARETANLGAVGNTARVLASIRLKQHQPAEARKLVEEAGAMAARTGSTFDHLSTLGMLGEVLESEGSNDEALKKYEEAIRIIEAVRATAESEAAFSDAKANARPYERIVRILIKLKRIDEAFDYLNRAKSQKLRDTLKLSAIKSGDPATQGLIDQASGLEKRLGAVSEQVRSEKSKPEGERDAAKLENLEALVTNEVGEFRRVIEKIKTTIPNWENFMTVNPMQLSEAQEYIPEGMILIQYAPIGEQLYIFTVTSESLKYFTPAVKPEDLWKKVKTVRRQITSGESGGPLTKNLSALYDMLIVPIESELTNAQTIGFIPNKLLYYLPMQALVKKGPQGETHYLIESIQIVYLNAANVMKVVQPPSKKKAHSGMVAFGNPTGADLPAAEIEVQDIAGVFPGTEVLSGAQVTKAAVRTKERMNKRIVHFATHGILNSGAPMESYLQLATGGAPDQSRLTVGEVWNLPFEKVDLVTLSACETALGDKDPDGGEITTLAEAFSTARASSVLASLWSVGDESTREFMLEFYSQLAAGKPKAAALQSAQLKLMKNPKFSRPLYWAPFILMGDWR